MGILAVIGIIILVYQLIKAACEKELPADYHNNWKLVELKRGICYGKVYFEI